MNDKTRFKMGFIKAMSNHGVTPDDFEGMIEKCSGVTGGVLGGTIITQGAAKAGKGIVGAIAGAPRYLGELAGERIPNSLGGALGPDDPLKKSLATVRGEALVQAYLNAAKDIKHKIDRIKKKREEQEAIDAETSQTSSQNPQVLYEEVTS
jgi:hypothetical protein